MRSADEAYGLCDYSGLPPERCAFLRPRDTMYEKNATRGCRQSVAHSSVRVIQSYEKRKKSREVRGTQETGLDKAERLAVIDEYRTHEEDTGSTQVQIALLTTRIIELTQHLREHKHDEATRRGLLQMVGRRRRLLRYLNREDVSGYRSLISKLGLRR